MYFWANSRCRIENSVEKAAVFLLPLFIIGLKIVPHVYRVRIARKAYKKSHDVKKMADNFLWDFRKKHCLVWYIRLFDKNPRVFKDQMTKF